MKHMHTSLDQLVKMAEGKCKAHLSSYRKAIERGGSRNALEDALRTAIDDASSAFSRGLGIQTGSELAKWSSDWSNYDMMLTEFMMAVPSDLLKHGLMKTCIEMTDNTNVLNLCAKNFIQEAKPQKLQALYEAGYKPAFDAYEAKDFLQSVKTVDHMQRELLLPFVEAFIETAKESSFLNHEHVLSMVGRYLGCKGGANATYLAFQKDVWPKLQAYSPLEKRKDKMNDVMQMAICEFSTAKTVGLLKVIAKDCLLNPIFVLDKAVWGRGYSWNRSMLDTHNPYDVEDVASKIPVEALLSPTFFVMINNNSMNEDFMCRTLPRLLESKQNYQDDVGYKALKQAADSLDMVSLMKKSPSISEKAAVIHILCLEDDRFDALFEGPNGRSAWYLFNDRMADYALASDRKVYGTEDYYSEISRQPLAEIHQNEQYLEEATKFDEAIKIDVRDFSENVVRFSPSFDKAKAYLESLDDMNESIAHEHCKALSENISCAEKDPGKLLRMISWKNERIMHEALTEDLGL